MQTHIEPSDRAVDPAEPTSPPSVFADETQPSSARHTNPDAAELSPVAVSQRLDAMDVLRGFALIGILLMNIEWFNRPIVGLGLFDLTLSGADHAVGWFVKVFVEGKFYKLFSLLFGMGFAVMLLRAEQVGRPFKAWFSRRMAVLFGVGMLHLVLLWGGDILHDYAVGGMLLLGWILLLRTEKLRRFATPATFLRVGLTMTALPFVVAMVFGIGYNMTHDTRVLAQEWEEQQKVDVLAKSMLADAKKTVTTTSNAGNDESDDNEVDDDEVDEDALSPEQRIAHRAKKRQQKLAERDAETEKEQLAYRQPSYWQATVFRAEDSLAHLAKTPFFAVLVLLPLFMLGYWFVASGAMRQPEHHRVLFRSMAWIGMLLGVALNIAAVAIDAHPSTQNARPLRIVAGALFGLGQYVLAAGYLGLIVSMLQSDRWRSRLTVLTPLGRMALTNYLTHSVILALLFHGYAGGQYGEISRAPQAVIVIAILVLQFYLSRWWLSRFQFGPVEWLWRSLTYLKRQPMRIVAA